MCNFENKTKNVWCKSKVCTFKYPSIIGYRGFDNKLVEQINNMIYEDITSFGDFFKCQIEDINDNIELNNAVTEYRVGLEKNNILSLAIEFSQLVGLNDISYMNTYNYDMNLCKKIYLTDIFDTQKDYLKVIKESILESIKEGLDDGIDFKTSDIALESLDTEEYYKNFYLDNSGVIFCFSSYELAEEIPILIEIKVPYEDVYEYLSDYTICKIVNE